MRCPVFVTRLACFVLLSLLAVVSSNAQVVDEDDDEEVAVVPKPLAKEVSRLRAALQRTITDPALADTMLAQARRLNYLPGQVVALCQVAAINFQQEQTDLGKTRLREAEQLAGQLRGIDEVSWAMQQVPSIQRKMPRSAQYGPFSEATGAIMRTLGKAMVTSGAEMQESVHNRGRMKLPMPPNEIPIPDKRRADKPVFPIEGVNFPAEFPGATGDLNLARRILLKPGYVDRWIDTLISAATTNPQLARQLTTRKKIRDSSQALSRAFAKEGNYAKAYDYFLQYTAYKDSLTAEATTRRLASLEYRQNLLRKEAQIKLLTKDRQLSDQESNRQRQYVFMLIGGVLLLGAFLVGLSRNNRAKHRANQRLNEQKETLQQTLEELKTTQNQLIQSEKMASLGELTAGIAHEIQNPLNFVNNFADISTELLTELVEHRQQPDSDPALEDELLTDVLQNLRKINQHGNRASSIVRGMLEHSRSSSGTKEPTNLNALTDEYARLAYHGIRAKDKTIEATLTTEFDPAIGQVAVVPQDVGRVLLNLFNNAFYAVGQRQQEGDPAYQGEVRVHTKRENGQISITIRDNGTGIPDAVKQKIFQPFFTTKPTGQGTGLGLSLSYDIITKGYGGTLSVSSEAGAFTEMMLTLPAIG